jgi:hypothetical protein
MQNLIHDLPGIVVSSPTYVFPAKTQNKQQLSRSYCVLCLAYHNAWKHVPVGLLLQTVNEILHFVFKKWEYPYSPAGRASIETRGSGDSACVACGEQSHIY